MKIKEHLDNIKNLKSQVMLSALGVETSFVSKVLMVEEGFVVLQNTIPIEYITAFSSAQKHFMTTGSFRLSANQVTSNGVNIVFSYDNIEETSESRSEERVQISDNETWCEFVNPLDGETVIRKRILDLSKTGLSLVTSWNSELLMPGRDFSQMTLVSGGQKKTVTGKIVYNRRFVNASGRIRHQIGFQLTHEEQ
jgi:hypothetical protein